MDEKGNMTKAMRIGDVTMERRKERSELTGAPVFQALLLPTNKIVPLLPLPLPSEPDPDPDPERMYGTIAFVTFTGPKTFVS
jgi:hypothetical protein